MYDVLKLTNLKIKFSKKFNYKMSFPENLNLIWFHFKTSQDTEFWSDGVQIFGKIYRKRYWNQCCHRRGNKFFDLCLDFADSITNGWKCKIFVWLNKIRRKWLQNASRFASLLEWSLWLVMIFARGSWNCSSSIVNLGIWKHSPSNS